MTELEAVLRYTGAGMDLRSHLESIRRGLERRKERAEQAAPSAPTSARSDTVPLTPAERATLADLLPIAERVARRVAREWGANAEELEHEAITLAVDAMRRFDGRGDIRGFVGLTVRQDLLDLLKYERVRRHVRRPVHHQRIGRQRPRTCRDVLLAKRERNDDDQARFYAGDEFAVWDDPSSQLHRSEAAAKVRHYLSTHEIEVLRERVAGLKPIEIARKLFTTPRRVYDTLANVRQCIDRAAREFDLPAKEITTALLNDNPALRPDVVRLLGEDSSEFSGKTQASVDTYQWRDKDA